MSQSGQNQAAGVYFVVNSDPIVEVRVAKTPDSLVNLVEGNGAFSLEIGKASLSCPLPQL